MIILMVGGKLNANNTMTKQTNKHAGTCWELPVRKMREM